jgi:hypothetical protein
MSTFAEMVTYVAKRLIDPDSTAVSTDDIKLSINDSVNYWKFRRFWFNEVADTASLTAQDASFPYPTDFLVPATDDDGFYVEYGNIRHPLVKITMQVYDALYLENGYGLPRWYARMGDDEYKCYPIPNIAYTIGRHYLKDYTDLSADADTNDFTNKASRLIELWSIGNLTTELRQDVDMGNYYRNAAENEYRNLRVLTNKMNGTGKLTIFSHLNNRGSR